MLPKSAAIDYEPVGLLSAWWTLANSAIACLSCRACATEAAAISSTTNNRCNMLFFFRERCEKACLAEVLEQWTGAHSQHTSEKDCNVSAQGNCLRLRQLGLCPCEAGVITKSAPT
eukprot:19425-Heterococcus_DN1.PRE.1